GGELHDVVDESIQDRAAFLEDAVAVFLLGMICTGEDPASRPTMKEVLEQLVQYDRTFSVAAACRDDSGGAPSFSKGKKDGKWKSSSAGMMAGKMWGAGASDSDEESGSFVAHPV
ncbi:hypothetical protein EE612_009909, partial [Oryza sativa]